MQVRRLTGEDIRQTRALYEEVFQDGKEYTDFFYGKAAREGMAFSIYDGDRIVSHAFAFEKMLRLGKKTVKAWYLYGVATREAFRHRGYMAAILDEIQNTAKAQGTQVLFLIPEKEEIYQSFGFVKVAGEEQRKYQRNGRTPGYIVSPAEDGDLCALMEASEKNMPAHRLVLQRTKEQWRQRAALARLEDGAVYLLRKKDKAGILISSGESEGIPELLEVIGDDREELIQSFLSAKGAGCVKELRYPVMIKVLDEGCAELLKVAAYIQEEL